MNEAIRILAIGLPRTLAVTTTSTLTPPAGGGTPGTGARGAVRDERPGRPSFTRRLPTGEKRDSLSAVEDAEFDSLNKAVSTLGEEFFSVPPAEIAALVAAEHRRYAGRPVRGFVPVLVERAVRAQLHSRTVAQAS